MAAYVFLIKGFADPDCVAELMKLFQKMTGKVLPPLYSDVIAKAVFSADVHPDRLNFLMRGIAKDPTINVRSSAGNESFRRSVHAKGMVMDIPSWLKDQRAADFEVQKVKQDFIFTRIELYASDMLLLQYSVTEGQKKGELDYTDMNEVLLIVLMVESPQAFTDFDGESDKYIHRFLKMTADTGLSYPAKAKMIYVQLDKCLKQFREGRNAEADDGSPDRLQAWLAAIADINDKKVAEEAEKDEELAVIRKEAYDMIQDKEVQNMVIQERYDRMDWVTYGNEQMKKGDRQRMEDDAKGMYAEGIKPDVIARIQKVSVDVIEKILGLQQV